MASNGNGEQVPASTELDTAEAIETMWASSVTQIGEIDAATENWKAQSLPLARIKKIMKSEEGVVQELERDRQQEAANSGAAPPPLGQSTRFMIAGEAPVLLGKACELLIKELTVRAWRHTERNRRRTLQRQDIHAAVGESEVFDFLIDIVPRVTTSQLPQKSFPSDPTAPQTTTASQAMVPVSGTRETTATGEAEARMHHIQQMHEHMQDAYAMQMHQARLQAEAQVATTQTVGQSTMMGAPPSFGMQSTPDGTLPQWAPNGNTGMPQ